MTGSISDRPETTDLMTDRSDPGLSDAARRTFKNISREWCLTGAEMAALLDMPDHLPISDASLVREFDEADTVMRMSYILGIYKAINTLLPLPERASAWMRKSNSAPPFCGRSALEVLIGGTTDDFRAVRAYLDANCN